MTYYVQSGDTLTKIANQYQTTVKNIMDINNISNPNSIYIGQKLIIPTTNPYSIQINTESKILKLLKDERLFREFPVAVGKPSTPTPKGNWKITKKAPWGEQFGGYFMQLSVPWGIYGIHGTNKPWSIGTAASNGCIRMNNRDAKELYETIPLETPVLII